LEFLSLEGQDDHRMFQLAFNRDTDHFPHLKTLILIGNSLFGEEIFDAEATKLPESLTKFRSSHFAYNCDKFLLPKHLRNLSLSIQSGDISSQLPDTLEKINFVFKTIPAQCLVLPSSVTWAHFRCRNGDLDDWNVAQFPQFLTHLGMEQLSENQILSLPVSLRSLQGLLDHEFGEEQVRALSGLVNLTTITGFLPYSLEPGLAVHLPRQLRNLSCLVPFSDLNHLPPSLTKLELEYQQGDELETEDLHEIWPFPSLTRFETDDFCPYIAKKLPKSVVHIEGGINDLSLEMVQLLPVGLEYLSCGILETPACIEALPRKLTTLDSTSRAVYSYERSASPPSKYYELPVESSFGLPLSLTNLTLGPIQITGSEWFAGLPRTLNYLVIFAQMPQNTDFAGTRWPPLLTRLTLALYVTPSQGVLPLMQSTPIGLKRLIISRFGDGDSGLTNEALGAWIKKSTCLKRLKLPKSDLLTQDCFSLFPKRLEVLELDIRPSWWPEYVRYPNTR
jgi:hypothetical protein